MLQSVGRDKKQLKDVVGFQTQIANAARPRPKVGANSTGPTRSAASMDCVQLLLSRLGMMAGDRPVPWPCIISMFNPQKFVHQHFAEMVWEFLHSCVSRLGFMITLDVPCSNCKLALSKKLMFWHR